MIHGVILTDNTYNNNNRTVNRASGAHRIAHHLRQHGYNIEIIDYCLRWNQAEIFKILDILITSGTLFLGIGSNLFLDRDEFNDTIIQIKQRYPSISIVLGGTNLLARNIPCIDYYVEGYAENSMLELLAVLSGNKPESALKFSDFATDRKFIDSNKDYPVHQTSDLSIRYLDSDFITPDQTLGIETARGCIFKCSFCTYPLIGKKQVDYVRDVDNIVNEIQTNYDQWGTTRYVINEDTFNDSIEKLELLEKGISKLPFRLEFVTYARLDLILAKKRSAELLRSMGLKGVHFGIDTFNSQAGKIIGKGVTGTKLKEGLLWWTETMPEVSTFCSIIVGLPEDNDDLFEHNKWFMNTNVQSWTWVPLYITDLNKTIHSSEFSKNYKNYGLDYMSDSEIRQYLNKEEDSNFYSKNYQTYANKSLRQKMIFWKNLKTGMNYFTAVDLAQKLNDQATSRRVPPWLAFDWTSLGYSLDEMRNWGWHDVIPHVPESEIDQKVEHHISSYKTSKINFNYSQFYSGIKHKKIIPIYGA